MGEKIGNLKKLNELGGLNFYKKHSTILKKTTEMKSKLLYGIFGILCLNFTVLRAQPNTEGAVIATIKINDHIHMLQWSGAGNMMLLSGKDGNNATQRLPQLLKTANFLFR